MFFSPAHLPCLGIYLKCYFCFCSVDGAKEDGSLGRLVNDNHIDPNAKMKYLTVQGKPHLCLFALRDISPGEEITYNYGDSDWPWRCKVIKLIVLIKELL